MKPEAKSGSESRAGVGVSSALMILVVLAMAALGMLAFSRARSTAHITQRNVEASVAYYEAAATLEERLAQIDLAALEASSVPESGLEWYEDRGIENVEWYEEGGALCFAVTIDDGQGRSLSATGRLLTGQSRRYELLSHCMTGQTGGEPVYLNLMGE